MNEKDRLKLYYFRLIGRRDYSEFELRKKANEKGYDSSLIDEIISELKNLKYIDDERFCESILNIYKGRKGKKWIAMKLKQARVDSFLIEKFLQTLEDNFLEDGFKEAVMRKYKIDSFENLEPKTKSKILNYLAYRGFMNPFEILRGWSG